MPSTESRIKKIAKRDGRLEDFDVNKICTAITKSAKEVGETKLEIADEVAQGILQTLEQKSKNTTTIEEVNDLLENMLMRGGHAKIAKAYILYRHKKEELRKVTEIPCIENSKLIILFKLNEKDELEKTNYYTNKGLKIFEKLKTTYGREI